MNVSSSSEIQVDTRGNTDVIDVTGKVQDIVSDRGIRDGIVCVFVPGATGAVTTIEYESALVEDLKKLCEELVPQEGAYAHNSTWMDGNGHSHLRASMFGPSLTVPIREGKLQLGTWQQIVFVDFDNRPRKRSLLVQCIGA